MTATHDPNSTCSTAPVLSFSLELGWNTWKLAFTIGLGQKPRLRTIAARDTDALLDEIKAAKKRFGLPDNAAVASCYEAGRDASGFIGSSWPTGSRTSSLTPRASKSTAASARPSPTASMP